MRTVKAREARARLSELLDEAEHGGTVTITRHGHAVARLVPAAGGRGKPFPDLAAFRDSIAVRPGQPAGSDEVIRQRDDARY